MISSWSFSKLQVFESCPLRAKMQWVDKIPDLQPKTAADRGTQIHQEAEDYVRAKAAVTPNLRHFNTDLSALARHFSEGRVTCEEEWGFDRQWNPCDWRSAWLRLKCDAVCHLDDRAHVRDFHLGGILFDLLLDDGAYFFRSQIHVFRTFPAIFTSIN